jgi:hypothetical protein
MFNKKFTNIEASNIAMQIDIRTNSGLFTDANQDSSVLHRTFSFLAEEEEEQEQEQQS